MARLLAVHLTGIAVLAGIMAFSLEAVSPAMPGLNRWLVIGLTTAYCVYWLSVVLLRLRPGAKGGLRRHNQTLALGGSLVIVVSTWLGGP